MDAIRLLKHQHKEVDELLEQLCATTVRAFRKRETLLAQVCDRLAAHAAMEEKIFYPSALTRATESLLRESLEEHLAVKRVIADLLELAVDDEQFLAKCQLLQELVRHHVKEEEQELLPDVKKARSKEELEDLGQRMERFFDEQMAREPRFQVPGQTAAAPPLG